MPDPIDTNENPTEQKNNVIKLEQKDFSDLEGGVLGETSLETVKSDLQRSLRKLHRVQVEELLEKVTSIEEGCIKEIRQTLEKHMGIQLEKHFQKLVQSSQNNISQLCAPLLKRAEEDVSRLNRPYRTVATVRGHLFSESYAKEDVPRYRAS